MPPFIVVKDGDVTTYINIDFVAFFEQPISGPITVVCVNGNKYPLSQEQFQRVLEQIDTRYDA